MGFTALLQRGIRVGAMNAEPLSSSGSTVLSGRVLHLPVFTYAGTCERRASGAAVRNGYGGDVKRAEEEEAREKKSLLGVASASIGCNAVLLMSVTKPAMPVSHRHTPFSWLSLPLLAVWGAILLNAFVQYRILERLTCLPQRRGITGRIDSTLNQRVADLEEDVRESVTTARGLSKQVEKLGVRFRATKRTLRDPMQETAAYARKASEVTTILAERGDRLEEELQGLQRALLAMQEHQVKQLSLISLALKRSQNGGTKQLPSSLNGSSSLHKAASDTYPRTHVPDVETPKRKSSTKELGRELKVPTAARDEPSSVNGTSSQRGDSAPKSTFSSEGSLSKVDFWKEPVTSSAVVDKMTVPAVSGASAAAAAAAASDRGDGPDRSNLGSFFKGRKRSTVTPPNAQALETAPVNADVRSSGFEDLPEPEDVSSYVEQPDYDSDSWLR